MIISTTVMRIYLVFYSSIAFLLYSCSGKSPLNTTIGPVTDSVFTFSVSSFHQEWSKDCNDRSATFSLRSGMLYYDYVYRGYPDDVEKHSKKKLDDATIDSIRSKLMKLSLYKNYSKNFPFKESGFRTEAGYSLTIKNDTAKYSLSVLGPGAIDIKDEVYESIYKFYYFINAIFPQNP